MAPIPMTTGRDALLDLLSDEGVRYLFGNPGTTELPVMDALPRHDDIEFVLGLQESVVLAMADGYARASGRLGVCNVHVAPGLGNAMGALFNAKFIGSPVLVLAGQQETGHGLTGPLLYDPLVPMAEPLVKWAFEVTRLADLPRVVHRAATVALTAPTGPVFISLPGDVLNDEAPVPLGRPTRVDSSTVPTTGALAHCARLLLSAERPAIIAGHELATDDALEEAAAIATRLGATVYQQTVAHGAHFPSGHKAFVGTLGRAQPSVRRQLSEHDLLLFLGADVLRMSVWSETDPMPPGVTVVQIGRNDAEMGKNYAADLALRCALKPGLVVLDDALGEQQTANQRSAAAERLERRAADNFSTRRTAFADEIRARPRGELIDPDLALLIVTDAVVNMGSGTNRPVLVEETISSSPSLSRLAHLHDRHSLYGLASGGIGFAIAGAVGIALAVPERPVVAVIGDGSAMYSIQALWTAANKRLPITYVILNNRGYRILKQRLRAYHGNERYIGMDFDNPGIDFNALSTSLGVPATTVSTADDLQAALDARANLAVTNGPHLIEVLTDPAL